MESDNNFMRPFFYGKTCKSFVYHNRICRASVYQNLISVGKGKGGYKLSVLLHGNTALEKRLFVF